MEGLEPSTNGLKGHCSAIELHAPMRIAFYHALHLPSTDDCKDILIPLPLTIHTSLVTMTVHNFVHGRTFCRLFLTEA